VSCPETQVARYSREGKEKGRKNFPEGGRGGLLRKDEALKGEPNRWGKWGVREGSNAKKDTRNPYDLHGAAVRLSREERAPKVYLFLGDVVTLDRQLPHIAICGFPKDKSSSRRCLFGT